MITLKDYAEKKHISYEAVRKQVNRYRDELGDHLYKQGRTQFLDPEGEAFLDEKRASNPIVVMEHDKDDRIAELEAQNEALKVKVMQLQDLIISKDGMIIDLQGQLLLLSQPAEQETKPVDDPAQTQQEECREQATENGKKWWHFWR